MSKRLTKISEDTIGDYKVVTLVDIATNGAEYAEVHMTPLRRKETKNEIS